MQSTPNEKDYYKQQSERKYGEFATKFQFGSNPSAEVWNGRLAMIGFLAAVAIELVSGQGFLHWLGLV
ncbi:chlorophyll A-B binding protein [Microcoleus sp. FACHB-1515]|uniref:chlorophyll a/b-binding protein n=1 Tax=Cyanophyceae TaxID=3028117 RepID=UPI001681EC1B|nr:chlorophyll a/b-binding protein [Microcoleus sp. FACHB-1515]MBD2092318.1 chlorophyll A-B binding protein [Microcoleus sp. FACHB-1515]